MIYTIFDRVILRRTTQGITLKELFEPRLGNNFVTDFNLSLLLTDASDESVPADLCEVREFDGVGAEKFAEHAFNFADKLVRDATDNRCYCVSVECAEHGANSAIYEA